MIKIDMDKMGEVVAQAIRCVNLYGEFDPHETIEGGKIIARTAIKAFCKELPYTGRSHPIYEQLLEYGKDA